MEAKDLRFSIVIPIYNASAYLPRAVEDILHQTYENWELLLVDDKSTDEGGSIAEAYAEKDGRIRVFHHEENLGVSAARNTGIAHAAGDYLLLLDADDGYEPELLDKLFYVLTEHSSDVVVYGFWEEYLEGDKKTYEKEFVTETLYLTDPEKIHRTVYDLNKMTMYGYPWNKAYRLSYLREGGHVFGGDSFGEDILFNISVFQNITSLQLLGEPMYHYINRQNEKERLTGKYLPEYFDCQKKRVTALLKQQELWGSVDEEIRGGISEEYFRSFFSMMEREYAHGAGNKEILDRADEEADEELFDRMKEYLPKKTGFVKGYMFGPIAAKDFRQALCRVKIVSFVRRNFAGVFARLKQDR